MFIVVNIVVDSLVKKERNLIMYELSIVYHTPLKRVYDILVSKSFTPTDVGVLYKSLLDIDGVSNVSIDRDGVTVMVSKETSWPSVGPEVLHTIVNIVCRMSDDELMRIVGVIHLRITPLILPIDLFFDKEVLGRYGLVNVEGLLGFGVIRQDNVPECLRRR